MTEEPTKATMPRRRAMLTAVAVAGIAASFVALTFLRVVPGGQQLAQLAGTSSESVAAQREDVVKAAAADADRAAKAKPVAQQVEPRSKAAAAKTSQVMIMNMAFSPATLDVSVGDTVTWTNMDEAPHNVIVTSGPVKFSSPTLQKGQKYSFTFTKAGTYDYYCSIHPNMKASVTAAGSSEPSPTPTPTTTPTTTPTSTPTSTPTTTPTTPPDDCGALAATVDAVLAHVYAAHLERSPSGQVTDILDLDQYVLTHTVWIESLLKPQLSGLTGASSETVEVFLRHLYAAHLERSLSGQVADIADVDQYVLTHTVMIEDMLAPLADAELGSC
jgi:amicyanin